MTLIGTEEIAQQMQQMQQPSKQTNSAQAAGQFEELILAQLVRVLRETSVSDGMLGKAPGASVFGHLVDQALTQALSDGGGIGLRDALDASLGSSATQETGSVSTSKTNQPHGESSPKLVGTLRRMRSVDFGPITGAPLEGATAQLQQAAQELLSAERSTRWSREGTLQRDDLSSNYHTRTSSGEIAAFNVQDAGGYQGQYKCNLFTMELARRAGFSVPVAPRAHGWGYPAPNGLTTSIEDGEVPKGWGRVVTGASATSIDQEILQGRRAFMLTGSAAHPERAGHMGIVERVHSIDYDSSGAIQKIVYDGWEARVDGARHLTRRTWNRTGTFGGTDPRGGFSRIEIIELRRSTSMEDAEVPLSGTPGASNSDRPEAPATREIRPQPTNYSSRSSEKRPNRRLEEHSS
ncbi:MAG: rod-binding protein [Myxococcota bacterium]